VLLHLRSSISEFTSGFLGRRHDTHATHAEDPVHAILAGRNVACPYASEIFLPTLHRTSSGRVR
jgi:hypothetical protein